MGAINPSSLQIYPCLICWILVACITDCGIATPPDILPKCQKANTYFKPGYRYLYTHEFNLTTRFIAQLPEYPANSTVSGNCVVAIEAFENCFIRINFDMCDFNQITREFEKNDSYYDPRQWPLAYEVEKYDLYFSYDDFNIVRIYPDPMDIEAAKNFKRAFISTLLLRTDLDYLTSQTILENDAFGVCPYEYDVSNDESTNHRALYPLNYGERVGPYSTVTVTRSKTFRQCTLQRDLMTNITTFSPWSLLKMGDNIILDLVYQPKIVCKYEIKKLLSLESIDCEEEYPVPVAGTVTTIHTEIRQHFSHFSRRNQTLIAAMLKQRNGETLNIRNIITQTEYLADSNETITKLLNEFEPEKPLEVILQKFDKLVDIMRKQNKSTFSYWYHHIKQSLTCGNDGGSCLVYPKQIPLLLDALTQCGTHSCARVLLTLLREENDKAWIIYRDENLPELSYTIANVLGSTSNPNTCTLQLAYRIAHELPSYHSFVSAGEVLRKYPIYNVPEDETTLDAIYNTYRLLHAYILPVCPVNQTDQTGPHVIYANHYPDYDLIRNLSHYQQRVMAEAALIAIANSKWTIVLYNTSDILALNLISCIKRFTHSSPYIALTAFKILDDIHNFEAITDSHIINELVLSTLRDPNSTNALKIQSFFYLVHELETIDLAGGALSTKTEKHGTKESDLVDAAIDYFIELPEGHQVKSFVVSYLRSPDTPKTLTNKYSFHSVLTYLLQSRGHTPDISIKNPFTSSQIFTTRHPVHIPFMNTYDLVVMTALTYECESYMPSMICFQSYFDYKQAWKTNFVTVSLVGVGPFLESMAEKIWDTFHDAQNLPLNITANKTEEAFGSIPVMNMFKALLEAKMRYLEEFVTTNYPQYKLPNMDSMWKKVVDNELQGILRQIYFNLLRGNRKKPFKPADYAKARLIVELEGRTIFHYRLMNLFQDYDKTYYVRKFDAFIYRIFNNLETLKIIRFLETKLTLPTSSGLPINIRVKGDLLFKIKSFVQGLFAFKWDIQHEFLLNFTGSTSIGSTDAFIHFNRDLSVSSALGYSITAVAKGDNLTFTVDRPSVKTSVLKYSKRHSMAIDGETINGPQLSNTNAYTNEPVLIPDRMVSPNTTCYFPRVIDNLLGFRLCRTVRLYNYFRLGSVESNSPPSYFNEWSALTNPAYYEIVAIPVGVKMAKIALFFRIPLEERSRCLFSKVLYPPQPYELDLSYDTQGKAFIAAKFQIYPFANGRQLDRYNFPKLFFDVKDAANAFYLLFDWTVTPPVKGLAYHPVVKSRYYHRDGKAKTRLDIVYAQNLWNNVTEQKYSAHHWLNVTYEEEKTGWSINTSLDVNSTFYKINSDIINYCQGPNCAGGLWYLVTGDQYPTTKYQLSVTGSLYGNASNTSRLASPVRRSLDNLDLDIYFGRTTPINPAFNAKALLNYAGSPGKSSLSFGYLANMRNQTIPIKLAYVWSQTFRPLPIHKSSYLPALHTRHIIPEASHNSHDCLIVLPSPQSIYTLKIDTVSQVNEVGININVRSFGNASQRSHDVTEGEFRCNLNLFRSPTKFSTPAPDITRTATNILGFYTNPAQEYNYDGTVDIFSAIEPLPTAKVRADFGMTESAPNQYECRLKFTEEKALQSTLFYNWRINTNTWDYGYNLSYGELSGQNKWYMYGGSNLPTDAKYLNATPIYTRFDGGKGESFFGLPYSEYDYRCESKTSMVKNFTHQCNVSKHLYDEFVDVQALFLPSVPANGKIPPGSNKIFDLIFNKTIIGKKYFFADTSIHSYLRILSQPIKTTKSSFYLNVSDFGVILAKNLTNTNGTYLSANLIYYENKTYLEDGIPIADIEIRFISNQAIAVYTRRYKRTSQLLDRYVTKKMDQFLISPVFAEYSMSQAFALLYAYTAPFLPGNHGGPSLPSSTEIENSEYYTKPIPDIVASDVQNTKSNDIALSITNSFLSETFNIKWIPSIGNVFRFITSPRAEPKSRLQVLGRFASFKIIYHPFTWANFTQMPTISLPNVKKFMTWLLKRYDASSERLPVYASRDSRRPVGENSPSAGLADFIVGHGSNKYHRTRFYPNTRRAIITKEAIMTFDGRVAAMPTLKRFTDCISILAHDTKLDTFTLFKRSNQLILNFLLGSLFITFETEDQKRTGTIEGPAAHRHFIQLRFNDVPIEVLPTLLTDPSGNLLFAAYFDGDMMEIQLPGFSLSCFDKHPIRHSDMLCVLTLTNSGYHNAFWGSLAGTTISINQSVASSFYTTTTTTTTTTAVPITTRKTVGGYQTPPHVKTTDDPTNDSPSICPNPNPFDSRNLTALQKNSRFATICRDIFNDWDFTSPLYPCTNMVSTNSYYEMCLFLAVNNSQGMESVCELVDVYSKVCLSFGIITESYPDCNYQKISIFDGYTRQLLAPKTYDIIYLITGNPRAPLQQLIGDLSGSVEQALNNGTSDYRIGLMYNANSVFSAIVCATSNDYLVNDKTFYMPTTVNNDIMYGREGFDKVIGNLPKSTLESYYTSPSFDEIVHEAIAKYQKHWRANSIKIILHVVAPYNIYDSPSFQFLNYQSLLGNLWDNEIMYSVLGDGVKDSSIMEALSLKSGGNYYDINDYHNAKRKIDWLENFKATLGAQVLSAYEKRKGVNVPM